MKFVRKVVNKYLDASYHSFETKEEVNNIIKIFNDFIYSKPYSLKYGELGRPSLSARRYKDGWGIHVTWNFIPGTCHAPKDGRLEEYVRWFDKITEIANSAETNNKKKEA